MRKPSKIKNFEELFLYVHDVLTEVRNDIQDVLEMSTDNILVANAHFPVVYSIVKDPSSKCYVGAKHGEFIHDLAVIYAYPKDSEGSCYKINLNQAFEAMMRDLNNLNDTFDTEKCFMVGKMADYLESVSREMRQAIA